MKIIEMVVTPEQAKIWLNNNFQNRNASARHVNKLTQTILNDQWQLNGESIKIGEGDTLIDGQHRLLAIVKANKPILTHVVLDAPKSIFETIDTGKNRTGADILTFSGFRNTTSLSGAIRLVTAIKSNFKYSSSSTNKEILEVAQADKENWEESITKALALKKVRKLLSPSQLGALYYLFYTISKQEAHKFFHLLETGENISRGNPLYALREHLIKLSYEGEVIDKAKWTKVYITILAWNAFRKNKEIKRFNIPSEFLSYPEIV